MGRIGDRMQLLARHWDAAHLVLGVLATIVAVSAILAGRFDVAMEPGVIPLLGRGYEEAHAYRQGGSGDVIEGEWTKEPDGLTLKPGQSGRLIFQVQNNLDASLIALIHGRGGTGSFLTVAVSRDGHVYREIMQDRLQDPMRVDLTAVASQWDKVWIRISATLHSEVSAADPLVLSSVRIVAKGTFSFPNLALASMLVLTVLLAYAVWFTRGRAEAFAMSLVVLWGLDMAFEFSRWTETDGAGNWLEVILGVPRAELWFPVTYVLLLGLFAWQIRVWDCPRAEMERWVRYALAGTIAWSGGKRFETLAQFAWVPLEPDAVWYMDLAENMTTPYGTGWREPLFIWIVKGWFWLWGGSALNLRLVSFLLSLLLLYVAYKVFREYTGQPVVGLLVATFLGLNPYLVWSSVRGLREEAYMIAILSFVYFIFVRPGKGSALWPAVRLALSGAAIQLLRFNSYGFVVPLLLVWAWRQGTQKWKAVAIPLVFITAVSVPHLVHNYQEYGDPLYSVNVHFAWARNYEFVILKQEGCEGCPSREQMEVDSTQGAAVGAYGYLFGLHSVQEVVRGTILGYLDMYLRPTDLFEIQSGTKSRIGFACYLLGLGLVLLCHYREMLGVILLLANFIPFAVILSIDARIGVHTAPFVAFILAYGVWWLFEKAIRLCGVYGAPALLDLSVPGALRR